MVCTRINGSGKYGFRSGKQIAILEIRDIKIRKGQPGEERSLAKMARETFWETYSGQNSPENMRIYMEEAFSESQISEELLDARSIFIYLMTGSTPAGYVKGSIRQSPPFPWFGDLLWIDRIYLYLRFQKNGLGSVLIKQMMDFSKENGLKGMGLAVWKKNLPAIAFYQKWGFEIVRSTTFLLGNDLQNDWLMFRSLE